MNNVVFAYLLTGIMILAGLVIMLGLITLVFYKINLYKTATYLKNNYPKTFLKSRLYTHIPSEFIKNFSKYDLGKGDLKNFLVTLSEIEKIKDRKLKDYCRTCRKQIRLMMLLLTSLIILFLMVVLIVVIIGFVEYSKIRIS